jgi:hypothetical protein
MNRYPHLDPFAFIGTQRNALPHSACNGLLPSQPPFAPPGRSNFGQPSARSMSRTRVQNIGENATAGIHRPIQIT